MIHAMRKREEVKRCCGRRCLGSALPETFFSFLERALYSIIAWFSEETEPDGSPFVREEIIYPTIGVTEHYIPKEVKGAFDAALKVRNLDGAICVLALRRALEKMCKQKGAEGKDLFKKLQDLQDKKVLPEIMNDVSYILRKEGNSAAHADDAEFDHDTVNLMIEFTQTILDYVYKLPEKIKKAQQRIKKHEPELETGRNI